MEKTTEKQQLDILKHKLVPSHIIISEDEEKELFEKLKITPDQLPKILNTDPTSISIGAKPGQIIKVIRKSLTAGEAVAYRFVVESTE
jgi:DNA-directed RNA polymerase subunit H